MSILRAGLGIDCLMVRYQGVDWQDERDLGCDGRHAPQGGSPQPCERVDYTHTRQRIIWPKAGPRFTTLQRIAAHLVLSQSDPTSGVRDREGLLVGSPCVFPSFGTNPFHRGMWRIKVTDLLRASVTRPG